MKDSRLIFASLSFLLLVACQNIPPNYANMSEEELYAYNAEQPVMDQVICRKEARTSTFIRKTRCQTIRQISNEFENSVMTLEVLSFGGSVPFSIRGD